MSYLVIISFLLGVAGGGSWVYVAFFIKRRAALLQEEQLEARAKSLAQVTRVLQAREQQIAERTLQLTAMQKGLDTRAVSYSELQGENAILKRDLHNMDVNQRKLMLDHETQQKAQELLDQRCKELGGRYLKENVKWVGSSITANNFVACKRRLQDVIERCRGIGLDVPKTDEANLIADLKTEFERLVRADLEREEQARIKAQIREEQKLEKEIDRELKQVDRERAAIQAALDKALAEAKDQHNEEVERLKARLAEAEEKTRRAMSRAQMTKSGYVYVISNIGSFGQNVFKVGMTRRLEPKDRVRELGDASVPFPFDIHMMISSDDAPKLENALHRALHKRRLNKIKPRKEFYRTDMETIRKIAVENHGDVEYVAEPEALEYHESLDVSDEDAEYIESVYEAEDEKDDAVPDNA
jgi:hypothetical protein